VQPVFPTLLAAWSERAAFVVFAAALLQPRAPAAVLIAAAGLLLRFTGDKQAAGRVGLLIVLLTIIAWALVRG